MSHLRRSGKGPIFGMVFAIVSLSDAILFALLRVIPPPH